MDESKIFSQSYPACSCHRRKMGYSMKTKKAIIVISLVDEAQEETNEAIEKEIFQELSKEPPKIPWCKKVEKVEVVEK
jgi:hypothetical protein